MIFTISILSSSMQAESLLTEYDTFQIQLAKSGLPEFYQDIINEKYERVVNWVENEKAELNPKDTSKGFPLLYATLTNNPAIVNYLIQKGANLNTEISGMPSIVFAVHHGLLYSFYSLFDAGAKTNLYVGKSKLIDIAYLRGYTQIWAALTAKGDRISVNFKLALEGPSEEEAKNEKVAEKKPMVDPFAGLIVSNKVLDLTNTTENQKAGKR
jgi:ankyrin repeat protein